MSPLTDYIVDSYASPTSSALSFLAALVEVRAKTTLLPLLQFIQKISASYPASATPRQKDGALRMLGALSLTAVKSKKLAPMLESFFIQQIVPEFKSPHGLLRYRACEIVEKYESVDMTWASQEVRLPFSLLVLFWYESLLTLESTSIGSRGYTESCHELYHRLGASCPYSSRHRTSRVGSL